MSTQFNLDASLANLPLDLLRKRYDQLTPAERKRLGFVRDATDAEMEYAAQGGGAPIDFTGRVFANPEQVKVSEDTESGVPVTRMPTGVTLDRGNYTGGTKFDVSNPDPAQLLAPEMRTVGAQSQPQIQNQNDDWFSQNAPAKTADSGGDWFEQNSPQVTQTKSEPASAASRLSENFLSGLGVTSDEQAKQFFTHPIDTLIQSVGAQGELAIKAKEAYQRGDYKAAVMHGLNYLVPFIGQQTDQAGEQLKEGDIAGGVGRTLGVTAPLIIGSPETRAAAGKVTARVGESLKPAAGKAARVASDIVDPELTGIVSPRAAHVQRSLGKLADVLERKPAAATVEASEIYRDATRSNEPYAGDEIPESRSSVERDATLNRRNIPEYAGEDLEAAPAAKTPALAETSAQKTVGSAAASTADTNYFQQARQELGADAPLSKVVDRAQQLKTGKIDPFKDTSGAMETVNADKALPKVPGPVEAAKEYLGTKRDEMAKEFLKTPQGKKFIAIYQKTLEEHRAGKFSAIDSAESFEEEAFPPKKPPQGTVTPETAEEMQDALERSLLALRMRRK